MNGPQQDNRDSAPQVPPPLPPRAGTPAWRMLLVLGGLSMLAGFLVVVVFQYTKPLIADNERVAIQKAVFQVIPGATRQQAFMVVKGRLKPVGDSVHDAELVYAGYDAQGHLLGVAVKAEGTGYQDVIRILYGYNPKCRCIDGYRVLKMAETPGLGDRIATDKGFLANFKALDAELNAAGDALRHAIVTVKHGKKTHPWQIDAISGSTISSDAVGRMINATAQKMLPVIRKNLDALRAGG